MADVNTTRERQKPSAHGALLGRELARLAEATAPLHLDVPERCKTCAFREGTIPNQMAGTLLEAMNCVLGIDDAPFGCHQALNPDGQPAHLCAGYVLATRAPFNEVKAAIGRVASGLKTMEEVDG